MSKAALNIHVQVFPVSSVFILLGKYLGVYLLSHRIEACLTLQEIARPIFKVLEQFYIPMSNI